MKHYIRPILVSLGVVGAVGLVASADAYACRGGHGHEAGHLEKADANGDGAIDRAELTTSLRARASAKLAKADANADGFLDREELTAFRAASKPERSNHARKGAAMSTEKKAKREAWKAKRAARMAERFTKADADGDGRLALHEMEAAADRRVARIFQRIDQDNDGVIDASERTAKRGRARGRRGREPGQ